MANLQDYPGISSYLRLLALCRSSLSSFADACVMADAPKRLVQHLVDAICEIRSAEVIVLDSVGIKDEWL